MRQQEQGCAWCGAAVPVDPQRGRAPWLCPTCDHDHEHDAAHPPIAGPKECAYDE